MIDQIPNKIPNNWTWTTLENILLSLESGKRPKGGVRHIKEGIPSIGGEHLDSNGGYDFSNIKYIPIVFFNSMNKGIIQKEDVLVVKDGATTGKTSFVDANFPFKIAAVNEHVFILRPYSTEIFPKYLFYWMFSPYGQDCVKTNFQGSAQGGINSSFIKGSIFPLPPYNEQVRIVGRVEELFSRLDAGVRSLQAAQTRLGQYRQATLRQAYTGKLTQEWRKNAIEPENRSTNFLPIPKDWKWESIGDIGEVSGGITKHSKRNNFPIKLPYLRVANVYAGRLDLTEVKKMGLVENEIERVLLEKNDLLIVEGNGSRDQIGRVALWDGSIENCIHQNHIIKVRFKDEITAKYVCQWLLSVEARKYILDVASTTAGLYTLSLSKVSGLPVPLAPVNEQITILNLIDSQFSVINHIQNEIINLLSYSRSLKRSILKKAFEGKLVPQYPNDEPASALLEHIKAQRVKQRKLM